MNGRNRLVVMLSVMVILALLVACGGPEPTATTVPTVPTDTPPAVPTDTPPAVPMDTPPAPEANEGITVTFEGDQCVFHGPDALQAGRIPVILDVKDQTDYEEYGLAVVTLDEGKSFEDLDAWSSTNQPPWAQLHGLLQEIPQGSSAEMTVTAFEGPLFLVCFTAYPITKSDALGPIEIEPAASSSEVQLTISAEALAGIWHMTTPNSPGGEVYRQFTADGTYRMGSALEELESQPRVEGEFWFEGEQILMRDVAAHPSYSACVQGGQVGRYTVERLANGQIRFIEVEDECRDRARMLGSGEMELVEWDLVVIGDSSMWGLADAFAAQIEADVGVKVVAHDAAVGGLSAGTVLEWLHSERPPRTRVEKELVDDLRQAEVVVMFASPADSMDAEKVADLASCIDARTPKSPENPEESCSPEAFEGYTADLAAIWAEILDLRDGQPTVVRATDIYNPVVSPWKEAGAFEACTGCWEAMSQAARLAAEAHDIPFLSRYDAYNGQNHELDPREDGYIVSDGEHPSDLMNQHTAELLSEMGYDPLIVGPAAVPGAEKADTAIAESGDTTWSYVALGDSVTWGMIPLYAEMLEEDLGVTVIVHNETVGGDHSSRLLERLRTSNSLRKELREANVITIEIPWNVFEDPCLALLNGSPGACGGSDNQDCLRKALETYKADADAIIAEIVSLRSPSEALIRIQDTYQFNVRQSKAEGAFETINRYWREANAHVIEGAEYYHIPVAKVYDAFMGEDGSEDPQDRGLIHDGFHTTLEGAALMAELFRDLGYEYVKP